MATNMDIDVGEAQTDSVSLEHPGLDYTFNVFLVSIADEITNDDLTTMKYLLQGDQGTGRGVLEKITSALKLFDHLRGRCLLSRDNILFLQAMLYHARRIDLYKKLIEFAKDRGNILHCYPESDKPVNGYKFVKFHVGGKEKLQRQKLEEIRSIASVYLNVPPHFVTVQGIHATQSFLITFMVPEECYECLYTIGSTEKQTLRSIGIDYVIVGDQIMQFTESTSQTDSIQGLQLNEELSFYFKQNAALQRQLEQYQLRELRSCKPEAECIGIMSSLTIIATLLFNIIQANKHSKERSNTIDRANSYFLHTLNKIKDKGYDEDLIGSLLEANSLVVRKNCLEQYQLLIEQQKWHIKLMEQMHARALYTQSKLKFLLGKGIKDSVLSENEEYFLHYLINEMPQRIAVRHVVTIGESIDQSQLRPHIEELSKKLMDKDKQKLRQAFELKSVEENILQKQNFCFIEILMVLEAKRHGGFLNIESFGDKLLKVINRQEFENQWHSQMDKFELKHQHQKSGTQRPSQSKTQRKSQSRKTDESDEIAKMDVMSEKLEIILRKMANIETLVQNPFSRLDLVTQFDSYSTNIDEMQEQFKGTL